MSILFVALFVWSDIGYAQTKTDSSKVAYDSIPYFFNDNFSKFHLLDSSLFEIQRYNVLLKNNNFYAINGHATLPARNLFYNPFFTNGLEYTKTNYDGLYYNNSEVEFIHTYYPVTLVKAVVGSKKEQVIDLLHSQQINPEINIGFKINALRTEGFYQKQQANTISFQAFNSYISSKGNYRSFFSYSYNRLTTLLNGGLVPDSSNSFKYEMLNDKALIPVHLHYAKQMLYGSDVYTKQIISLDHQLNHAELRNFNQKSAALNKLVIYGRYREYFRNYEDRMEDSTYYHNFYFTTQDFKDKLKDQHTKVEIQLINTVGNKAVNDYLGYEVTGGIENLDINVNQKKRNFLSAYTGLLLSKNFRNISLSTQGKYFFSGFNQGNYQALASITSHQNEPIKWQFSIGGNKILPQQIYNFYYSNNFIWDHSFQPITNMIANVELNHTLAGNIFLQYNSIKNYVLLNNQALPQQLSQTINLWQLKYNKKFNIGILCIAPEVLLQFENSTMKYLALPEFYTKTSMYVNHRIFKGKLWYQFGADVYWLNSYKPYSYMAASNMYFYQNTFSTSGLPLINLFLNFKIKAVQAFATVEQLSSVLSAPYFFTPYYAMPGLTFKLGINWLFIN